MSDLTDAFIVASVTKKCIGELYNVGSGVGTKLKDMVKAVVDTVGKGEIEFSSWSDEYINVETGDYVTDINKIYDATKWKPLTDLKTGVKYSFEYYDRHRSYYW